LQAADDYAKWFVACLRGIDAVLQQHAFPPPSASRWPTSRSAMR
jgi:hypothetical protein